MNAEMSAKVCPPISDGFQRRRFSTRHLVALISAVAIPSAALADVNWAPSNGSTDISDPLNWNGSFPGNNEVKLFTSAGLSGDYTVKVPASTAENPYVDKAGLQVDGNQLLDGQKVTLDATGAYWLQMSDAGTGWRDGKAMRIVRGDHIFNIEGLNANSAYDNFGFSLADGKISFLRDDTNGSRLVFEGGTFNNAFTPGGDQTQHSTVLFHSSESQNAVVELAGGDVTFRQVHLRALSGGTKMLVTGGNHHIYDGIRINTYKGADNSRGDATLQVSGGKLTVEQGNIWLGHTASDKGILRVDGTGEVELAEASGGTVYFPDGAGWQGLLSIGGHGSFVSYRQVSFGHNAGTGEILVEDDGSFYTPVWFPMGEGDNCNLTVMVKDRGLFRAPSAGIVQGTGRKMHMTIEGSATAEINCGNIANNATAEFSLDLKDDAVLKIGNNDGNIMFGNNSGGKIDFNMTGGSLERYSGGEANDLYFLGGPSSTYTIAGGTITTRNMRIEGVQNDDVVPRTDYTNTVRMTGGTVNIRMNGNGDGLDIRGNNRNAMMLVEGGELNVGTRGAGMLRLGHGGDGDQKYHSVLRQTGGTMNLGATVNICDSNVDGELELLGGVCRVWTIRGWNYCDVRGNAKKATLYGNGGTIVPWENGLTFLYTMSGVYVGEDGLAIDTAGFDNVTMRVKVDNKGDADGLFIKKGAGILKVGLVETDGGARNEFAGRSLVGEQTYTRIDEGKLVFVDTNKVVFGKNVIVKGGATLSLEGTPDTMTVDTLTLGDGRGFAVLKLDAGDTIVVEEVNGVGATCGLLNVPWKSTEGTYHVFTCKAGVTASELDKIGVSDADSTKDYIWTTTLDQDTGYTICSVTVAPAGTVATKTITYANGGVTTNGTGLVSGIVASGNGVQSGAIEFAHTATISVDDAKTLSLAGPLVGTGVELVKTGSGLLTVGGINPDFYGSFVTRGGIFEVGYAGAFGPVGDIYFPLVLGGGTFRYSGTDEVVFAGPLSISADEYKKPVVLDTEGDMTFKSTEHMKGAFIKIGTGTLKFDLPAGAFQIGSGINEENMGENGGAVSLPANGDSPTSNSGLYGVTVLEGTMRVVGVGVDKTTLETKNTALLGGGYPAQAAAILDVENASVRWGDGSRHGCVCRDLPARAPSPEVHLKNARFWSDSPQLGRHCSDGNAVVKLVMKDSEYYGHYNSAVGGDTVGVMIDADNSQVHSDAMIGWTVQAKALQADFYGADAEFASFDSSNTGNEAGRISFYDRVTGELKIRDGAALRTTRGVKMNSATLDVVFDGGRFEISPHNNTFNATSVWNNVTGTGYTTTGNGMEIAIAENMTHSFDFPIKGTGGVVKTGLGTFELVEARAEGEKLLQYTGGTVVSNGTLVVNGSVVDGSKTFSVATGATLDLNASTLVGGTLSGAGTIANGTLSATTLEYGDGTALPTFSGVAGEVTVNFGCTTAYPLDLTAAKTGIVVGHYTGNAPSELVFRAADTGLSLYRPVVSFVDGDIVMKFELSGFMIFVK